MIMTLLAVSSAMVFLATITSAQQRSAITDFVLVNADTGKDILLMEDGMIINTSMVGMSLTVRAETANYNSYVKFDLDSGKTRRVEPQAPYMLAGKSSSSGENDGIVTLYQSNLLVQAGAHTLTAYLVDNGYLDGTAAATENVAQTRQLFSVSILTIAFTVQNGSGTISGDATIDGNGEDGNETVSSTDLPAVAADAYGNIYGVLEQFSIITLSFSGPIASETGTTEPGEYRPPSTFADYRFDLVVTHNDTGTVVTIPGYYSGNGNAANSGAISGAVWQCKFRADQEGDYTWVASFVQGTNVASTSGGGNPGGFFDGTTGSFAILPTEELVPPRQTVFVTGLDMTDFLNYADFDGAASDANTYTNHVASIDDDVPTWAGGKGKAIAGALLDMQGIGVDTLTMSTLSNNVDPFVDPSNRLEYDVSKMAQWDIVISYATKINLTVLLFLNSTSLSDTEERNLYIREMVARFGQAVGFLVDSAETAATVRSLGYSKSLLFLHVDANERLSVSSPDSEVIDGIVLFNPSNIYETTMAWKSVNPKLAIAASLNSTSLESDSTGALLWSNLFAGGSGLLVKHDSDDLASLAGLGAFLATWVAKSIWQLGTTPLTPNMEIVSGEDAWCLSDASRHTVLVYTKTGGGTIQLQLGVTIYSVEWFDPLLGEVTQNITKNITGSTPLGSPPSLTNDWVAELLCTANCSSE